MYFVLGIQGGGFKSVKFYSIQHLSLFFYHEIFFVILRRINNLAYWYVHCTSYVRLWVQVSQILLNTILKFIFYITKHILHDNVASPVASFVGWLVTCGLAKGLGGVVAW